MQKNNPMEVTPRVNDRILPMETPKILEIMPNNGHATPAAEPIPLKTDLNNRINEKSTSYL